MARTQKHESTNKKITPRFPQEEIRFYRANEKPWGVFSNLYKRSITFEGETFETSEHAYQAGKPRKAEVRKWILSAPSPSLVAMAAHGLYVWDINSDWSKIKFDRMKAVLSAKFSQHSDLQTILLSTGNSRLVESATVDNLVNRTWGEVNGQGKNMLGKLLMEVRAELKLKSLSSPTNTTKNKKRKSIISKSTARKMKAGLND
jgi:ribA/ribD-fused uncharacterized protein